MLEAAAVSGVPVHTLKSAIFAGALPATRRGRRSLMRDDLDEWLRDTSPPDWGGRCIGKQFH